MPATSGDQFVFNLVWTEGAFEYLGLFTSSLLANSDARYRFVANACRRDEIDLMEAFAGIHPERITDVVVVSESETLRHGDALDEVREHHDDGDFFCLIDPDIIATGAFVKDLASALGQHAAVTSGRELWSDDNVLPIGHPGVNGEYFFRSDGFLFGSPHFAIYDSSALAATMDRWSIGFGEGGNGLGEPARRALADAGHDYLVYDTAKLVNIFLQIDGHTIHHEEHDDLIHVGGLLHYLWAPRVTDGTGAATVDWAGWRGMTARHEVARYTATVLRSLLNGDPAPDAPPEASAALAPRLARVRATMIDVVEAYGDEWLRTIGRGPGPERAARSSYDGMRRPAPVRPSRRDARSRER